MIGDPVSVLRKLRKQKERDERLLEALSQNCRLTMKELSTQLKIPITTIHRRMDELEKAGVILNYSAIVDWRKFRRL